MKNTLMQSKSTVLKRLQMINNPSVKCRLIIIEHFVMLLLKECEKTTSSKVKSVIKKIKTAVYALMVVRILVAIYMKVKSTDEQ